MKSTAKPAGIDEPLTNLLKKLKIVEYDMIIIGDGSGSTWQRGTGWASVSIERNGHRRVWYGAVNRGTVNFGEIMACVLPLTWLQTKIDKERGAGTEYLAHRVHIITDSEYCRNTGNNIHAGKGANSLLWNIFRSIRSSGIVLTWHWIRRNSAALHDYCDTLSRAARIHMEETPLSKRARAKNIKLTDINP